MPVTKAVADYAHARDWAGLPATRTVCGGDWTPVNLSATTNTPAVYLSATNIMGENT